MNNFLRHCLTYNRDTDLIAIATEFRDIVRDQKEVIRWQQNEIQRLQLETARWGREIISGFLVALDTPEDQDELRDRLHESLIDMSDEVARLEEHVQ